MTFTPPHKYTYIFIEVSNFLIFFLTVYSTIFISNYRIKDYRWDNILNKNYSSQRLNLNLTMSGSGERVSVFLPGPAGQCDLLNTRREPIRFREDSVQVSQTQKDTIKVSQTQNSV